MLLSGARGGGDLKREGWAALFSVEIKAGKQADLATIRKAFAQAEGDLAIGDPRLPLVGLRPDRARPMVVLYAQDFLGLLTNQGPAQAGRIRDLARQITRAAEEITKCSR